MSPSRLDTEKMCMTRVAKGADVQIEIGDELAAWLEETAAKKGKTAEKYANDALWRYLEDVEDYASAVVASRQMENGEERTYTLEEVERELGMESIRDWEGRPVPTERKQKG